MGISSHSGIVLLVIVGLATIIGVIIIATIEVRRADSENPPTPQQTAVKPTDKKRG
ncbi:MAG: hypothetical protein ABSG22_04890 [Sedimentisphaerales bacterium]|jgi:hypothetical protein